MSYPPQLPAVLFSALNSVEGSPVRRRQRAAGTQTSHTGHRTGPLGFNLGARSDPALPLAPFKGDGQSAKVARRRDSQVSVRSRQ